MTAFPLMSLATNHYEIESLNLELRQSQVAGLYLIVFNDAVPLAPAYPEGYLSIDLTTITHLIWLGHHRAFVQNSRDRRYFEFSFRDTVTALRFVTLVRELIDENLIEQIRTPVEMDIVCTSWTFGKLNAATLENETVEECTLLHRRSVSPANSALTTPPSTSLLDHDIPQHDKKQLLSPSQSPASIRKSKVEQCTKICETSQEALELIYKTGRWSDLTIVSGDCEFKAHKAIICPRSSFFSAALSSNFSEAKTGIITLNESPAVVEAIIQFIYDQGIKVCRSPPLYKFSASQDPKKISTMSTLVDIYNAADKYGIQGIQPEIVAAVQARLPFISKPRFLVSIAEYTYDTTPYYDGQACSMRDVVVSFLKTHLKAILLDKEASAAVLENRSLMFDLLGHFADSSTSSDKLRLSVKREREEVVEDLIDGRRKSRRVKQHIPGTYKLRLDLTKDC